MEITVKHLTEPAELYCQIDGEGHPQPVALHVDLGGGEIYARYNEDLNPSFEPSGVREGRIIAMEIPILTTEIGNGLLDDAVPIAARIVAGSEIYWDGNVNRGRLVTEDAHVALGELAALVASYGDRDVIVGMDADEYLSDAGDLADEYGLTADSTDLTLGRIAVEIEEAALADNIVVVDVAEYLAAARDRLRDVYREELSDVADQIAELTGRRDRLISRQLGWGDTTREVGTRARMSHVGVQKIRARATGPDGV